MRISSLRKVFVLALTALALSACGNDSELRWTEEVKLPDGRVITLSRWVEFKGPHQLGQPPTESSQSFTFKHPETQAVVSWKNNRDQGLLETVALLFDKDTPLLLGKPAYGGDSYKYNCPNPPYLLYEYRNGQWQSKPLAQVPVKRIRANLTTQPMTKREEINASGHHLSSAQTSASYTYIKGVYKTPYVIQFEGMPTQTFKSEDCSHVSNRNYLIHSERK